MCSKLTTVIHMQVNKILKYSDEYTPKSFKTNLNLHYYICIPLLSTFVTHSITI